MKNFHFFIKPENVSKDRITITGELLHRMKNVLRYNTGDSVKLLTQPSRKTRGKKYTGVIESISDAELTVKILSEEESAGKALFTTLYISLIKTKNFQYALQKATELGVSRIVPLLAQRSVVKIAGDSEEKKLVRWRAIVREAAEQCKRSDIPEVTRIIRAEDIMDLSDSADVKIVCDENGGVLLKDYVSGFKSSKSISAAIGPEGGFTSEEMEAFSSSGFAPVLLSEMILRAETVPIFLMSVFQFEFSA